MLNDWSTYLGHLLEFHHESVKLTTHYRVKNTSDKIWCFIHCLFSAVFLHKFTSLTFYCPPSVKLGLNCRSLRTSISQHNQCQYIVITNYKV